MSEILTYNAAARPSGDMLCGHPAQLCIHTHSTAPTAQRASSRRSIRPP